MVKSDVVRVEFLGGEVSGIDVPGGHGPGGIVPRRRPGIHGGTGGPRKLHWTAQPWLRLLVGLLLLNGCGLQREGAPTTSNDPVRLLAAHWDQVCRDYRGVLPFSGPDDVVQVEELQVELAGLWTEGQGGPSPEGRAGLEVGHDAVDVAISFQRDGQLRSVHFIPEASRKVRTARARTATNPAAGLEEAVRRHLRPQRRFLDRTHLRLRVGGPPSHLLEILPPLECLPHIQHDDHQPPTFLEGAQVQSGVPRMGDPDERAVGVALHLSEDGTLQEIEFVRGGEDLIPRLRAALAETQFDPALMNGEPVPGSLTMTFRFP